MPYWKDWKEYWVEPLYGSDLISGMPDIVLSRDPKSALKEAQTHWPDADGWGVLGLVDPEDRERCLDEEAGLRAVVTIVPPR